MRLGLALAPGAALSEQARAIERAGLDLVWIDDAAGGPPLLTAATVAAHTTTVRLAAAVTVGAHPLAIAENAFVADQVSGGRLVLVLVDDGAGENVLRETAEILLAAASATTFAHAGPRWTIPALLEANDGAQPQIMVTPPPVAVELPIWVAGPSAPGVASDLVLGHVAGPGEDGRSDPPARLRRVAIRTADPAAGADALVARLRADAATWGMDTAILAAPPGGDPATIAAWLATQVRPRVQHPLPAGLEDEWTRRLAQDYGTDLAAP